MGQANAPGKFIQIMSNLFLDMLDKQMLALLDDNLIYSITIDLHFKLMEKVFTHLYKHVLYCKLKKYSLLQKTTTFLKFGITPEGMYNSYAKVRSLKK